MNLCFTESIKDFPGYIIAKDGRVISLPRTRLGRNRKPVLVQGRVLTPIIGSKDKRIVQLKDGVQINVFSSLKEAAGHVGGLWQGIQRCCNLERTNHREFQWRFYDSTKYGG